MQRGVSIDHIAAVTKVSVDLWLGLERNDFSHWPTGIYARAYVREYASQIGVDPDQAVNDFCRWFPQGDRRAERLVRDHAALVGHELDWTDDLAPGVAEDRRSGSSDHVSHDKLPLAATQKGRVIAALADLALVGLLGTTIFALTPLGLAVALAACAMAYHAIALVALGCTPAMWALDTYLAHRHPDIARPRARFIWMAERTGR
jgi:hypothetical protein